MIIYLAFLTFTPNIFDMDTHKTRLAAAIDGIKDNVRRHLAVMSDRQLGAQTGLSHQTIRRWINDGKPATTTTLFRLAQLPDASAQDQTQEEKD